MVPKPTPALSALYDADEVAWLDAMVELLDLGAHHALDFQNLRECLNDMSISHRNEVENRLVVLLRHMLKWHHQPGKRTPSWRSTLVEQRQQLHRLCGRGVLRNHATAVLADAYADAVELAASDTSSPEPTFPAVCPYTLDQLLTFDPPRVGPDGSEQAEEDQEDEA